MSAANESAVQGRASRPGVGAIVLAALLDAAVVIAFAASGRSEHGKAVDLAGVWQTAWPFLLGLAVSWFAVRAWRAPVAWARTGLPLLVGTLGIGMITRVTFTEGGAALPFMLVATGVLALGLVGWRLIAALIRKLRK